MRCAFAVSVIGLAMASMGCDFGRVTDIPTEPTAVLPPVAPPAPVRPPIPGIAFGEVVRFRFASEDFRCSARLEDRCRSFNVIVPSNGQMDVALTPTSLNDPFNLFEMYIVPGADDWEVGPGRQIRATARVTAGQTYEIRMYVAWVPTFELELRTSLR
jgi:hypothetical protein